MDAGQDESLELDQPVSETDVWETLLHEWHLDRYYIESHWSYWYFYAMVESLVNRRKRENEAHRPVNKITADDISKAAKQGGI